MRIQKAKVTPKILKWARGVCSLSLEAAATKASISEDKLASWESGADQPTVNQARSLAKIYRVPLISFWLNEPPPDYKPPKIRDFRRLPGGETGQYSYNLSICFRDATIKRDLALEMAQNLNRKLRVFSHSFPTTTPVKKLANEIRTILGIGSDEQRSWKDSRLAFNTIKSKIELLDILVLQFSRIEVEEFRGFSIHSQVMPIIGLNRKDSPAARTFSLLHEFTHLLFGETGVSNASFSETRFNQNERIEKICNEVAGTSLVPADELRLIAKTQGRIDASNISSTAKQFGASREVVAIRLFQTGILKQEELDSLLDEIRWAPKSPPKPGFVPPHMDFVSKAGKPLARSLLDNLSHGYITESDFSGYSGLKIKHIDKVKEAILSTDD